MFNRALLTTTTMMTANVFAEGQGHIRTGNRNMVEIIRDVSSSQTSSTSTSTSTQTSSTSTSNPCVHCKYTSSLQLPM